MYDQLAKVRDEKEAAARPGGQDWNGINTAGRPRIILVSRRLPYKLQASFVVDVVDKLTSATTRSRFKHAFFC